MHSISIRHSLVKGRTAPAELTKYFILAVLAHVFVWTLLPLLFHDNVALDMVEGLAWGKEWQLGYEKDPPLFPWVIHTIMLLSDKALWISYLASQLCVATAFFAVWQLGKRIASEQDALIGALLLEGIYYFNLPTLEFNDILLQMPFAALFGWLLHRAITDDRLQDWMLCGVVASLGVWSRYSMGAYILPMAVFALAHPFSRRRLASKGPWVLLATAILLFSPHLYWIVDSDFISIKYVGNRAPEIILFGEYIKSLLSFIGAQLLALLPMLCVALMLWRWRPAQHWLKLRWQDFDSSYLTALALGPLVVSLFLSALAMRPIRAMWGAPLWTFIGLFLVLQIQPVLTLKRWHLLGRAWLILLLLPVAYFVAEKQYGPKITGNEQPVHFPGKSLGFIINDQWYSATGQSLKYVAGDTWSAGNISFYAEDRPSVIFSHGDLQISPWVEATDLKRSGAVLVWNVREEGASIPEKLAKKFPTAISRPIVTVKGKLSHQFGVAFVFPEFTPRIQ